MDDDLVLGRIVTMALEESGFVIHYQNSLAAIQDVAMEVCPDIIILDVEIGDKNGIEIVPQLKTIVSDVPILFISSHVDGEVAAKAINAGGTAYLKKPIDIVELIAYINRHASPLTSDHIDFGSLTLQIRKNLLLKGDTVITQLTLLECKLLRLLIAFTNQTVTRKSIEKEVWIGKGSEHSLNNYISRLRKMMSVDPDIQLLTIPKSGYQLAIRTARRP